MTVVERLAEAVARGVTRRSTLRATAAMAFAGFAGLAASGQGAEAARCAVRVTDDTACNKPWNRYCNDVASGACDGANCAGSCTLDPHFYPQDVQSACWCTALEKQGKNRYAYWMCCDCQCPDIEPGCVERDEAGTCIAFACREEDEQGHCLMFDRGCGCRERVAVAFKPAKKRRRR